MVKTKQQRSLDRIWNDVLWNDKELSSGRKVGREEMKIEATARETHKEGSQKCLSICDGGR